MESKVKPGSLKGWTNTRTGEDVSSFEQAAMERAGKSTALIWYVDPDKRTPLWVQLFILWLKKYLLRQPL